MLAVYRVTKDAVARAYAGEGPTLIEAMTYRMGPHSTADDAGRYRDEAEVERWRAHDPIDRYRTWLLASGHADEAFVAACEAEAEARVARIRAGLVATEPPPVVDVRLDLRRSPGVAPAPANRGPRRCLRSRCPQP